MYIHGIKRKISIFFDIKSSKRNKSYPSFYPLIPAESQGSGLFLQRWDRLRTARLFITEEKKGKVCAENAKEPRTLLLKGNSVNNLYQCAAQKFKKPVLCCFYLLTGKKLSKPSWINVRK